jgi:hypothetical protein
MPSSVSTPYASLIFLLRSETSGYARSPTPPEAAVQHAAENQYKLLWYRCTVAPRSLSAEVTQQRTGQATTAPAVQVTHGTVPAAPASEYRRRYISDALQ